MRELTLDEIEVVSGGETPAICSFTGEIGGGLFGLAAGLMGTAVAGPFAGGAFAVIMGAMFGVAAQNVCIQHFHKH